MAGRRCLSLFWPLIVGYIDWLFGLRVKGRPRRRCPRSSEIQDSDDAVGKRSGPTTPFLVRAGEGIAAEGFGTSLARYQSVVVVL
jgi:hypothetical protein